MARPSEATAGVVAAPVAAGATMIGVENLRLTQARQLPAAKAAEMAVDAGGGLGEVGEEALEGSVAVLAAALRRLRQARGEAKGMGGRVEQESRLVGPMVRLVI